MIRVKTGVTPKLLVIAAAAANAASDMAMTVTITSGVDGVHMKGSKHYSGEALDFRTRGWSRETIDIFMHNIKRRLGRQYDVVLEVDHIHVEYDPKT